MGFQYANKKQAVCEKCANAGKYGPEKASYLDTFYAVRYYQNVLDRVVSFEKDTTRN